MNLLGRFEYILLCNLTLFLLIIAAIDYKFSVNLTYGLFLFVAVVLFFSKNKPIKIRLSFLLISIISLLFLIFGYFYGGGIYDIYPIRNTAYFLLFLLIYQSGILAYNSSQVKRIVNYNLFFAAVSQLLALIFDFGVTYSTGELNFSIFGVKSFMTSGNEFVIVLFVIAYAVIVVHKHSIKQYVASAVLFSVGTKTAFLLAFYTLFLSLKRNYSLVKLVFLLSGLVLLIYFTGILDYQLARIQLNIEKFDAFSSLFSGRVQRVMSINMDQISLFPFSNQIHLTRNYESDLFNLLVRQGVVLSLVYYSVTILILSRVYSVGIALLFLVLSIIVGHIFFYASVLVYMIIFGLLIRMYNDSVSQ